MNESMIHFNPEKRDYLKWHVAFMFLDLFVLVCILICYIKYKGHVAFIKSTGKLKTFLWSHLDQVLFAYMILYIFHVIRRIACLISWCKHDEDDFRTPYTQVFLDYLFFYSIDIFEILLYIIFVATYFSIQKKEVKVLEKKANVLYNSLWFFVIYETGCSLYLVGTYLFKSFMVNEIKAYKYFTEDLVHMKEPD